MPLTFKLNSQIKLVSHKETMFSFETNEGKLIDFQAENQELFNALFLFINEGVSLENSKKWSNLKPQNETRFLTLLNNFEKNCFLDYFFEFQNGKERAIISPISQRFQMIKDLKNIDKHNYDSFYSLSRFTYFHTEKDKIVLEHPTASFRVFFTEEFFINFLPIMNGRKNLFELINIFQENKNEVVLLLMLLIRDGILHLKNKSEENHLKSWEFHDLLFHSSSRSGHLDDGKCFGKTYRFRSTSLSPPSSITNIDSDKCIKLYKPNMEEIISRDIPLSRAIEFRRSIRSYDKTKGITLKALGEFLYRSVATRELIKGLEQDAFFRPYPSAGALHEIKFYLVIKHCLELKNGVYSYDAQEHTLLNCDVKDFYIDKFILNSSKSMGKNEDLPHVLIIFTSYFQKIAWKYEKIAYRCSLISMGTICQTMSLVATAMNLGSCIIGVGNSNLFSEATGIDPLVEGAIGEFALGIPLSNIEDS